MDSSKIVMYGAMWCPDTLRAISFFNQQKIEFVFKDVENNSENTNFVKEINHGERIIPTIIFPNGTILTEPSNSELEKAIQK